MRGIVILTKMVKLKLMGMYLMFRLCLICNKRKFWARKSLLYPSYYVHESCGLWETEVLLRWVEFVKTEWLKSDILGN